MQFKNNINEFCERFNGLIYYDRRGSHEWRGTTAAAIIVCHHDQNGWLLLQLLPVRISGSHNSKQAEEK
jgi:hypothetical protein